MHVYEKFHTKCLSLLAGRLGDVNEAEQAII